MTVRLNTRYVSSLPWAARKYPFVIETQHSNSVEGNIDEQYGRRPHKYVGGSSKHSFVER